MILRSAEVSKEEHVARRWRVGSGRASDGGRPQREPHHSPRHRRQRPTADARVAKDLGSRSAGAVVVVLVVVVVAPPRTLALSTHSWFAS